MRHYPFWNYFPERDTWLGYGLSPSFMNFRVLLLAPLLSAFVSPAFGIITINSDTASLSAPSNGAPWDYVARLDNGFGARASGDIAADNKSISSFNRST